ncbi:MULTISPECIES: protein TolR [Nitrosomonas]|jgi:biopolymer transport protein TolR|uniref:Protein TolR n=1 Tax=Nitrosomonas oligotropha TaxID=42354 RepID=A0A1H8NQW1_9PROT|nr:protein TolR [Nitrosomonas oligotropha]MBK7490738.1 protein TolR [Nitrosomonas sp.]MBP9100053.1 protein TolR [Nitrosomonas sp.]MBX9636317.1 protein TolR [Nitrosomonas sp.]PTQ78546.1 cell division and transport-associated protein TolR [Nitrosomonas oligotropha]TXI27857.1 MAG: protein TolR [Nitrosomonas oligotropha]
MARRAKHRLMNDINVVPYIDVMLVLLIIFMITAPMINHGQIELPQIGKSLATPAIPLEVIIKADGSLTLRDRAKTTTEQKVDRNQLIEAIKQKQAQNAEQPVVIAADKNVRYEEVIKVMDILQQNQVQKVGLLAQQK